MKRETKIERMARLLNGLAALGFSYSEAQSLRRIELTLGRWGEQMCGDSDQYKSWAIERDEETGKPFLCIYPHDGPARRAPIADREAGAKRRLERIMAKHPELVAYHQTDPRGCSLYILRRAQLEAGDQLDCVYTRGLAVCAD